MFKKGVSGNPAGRPKKSKEQTEFEKKCQKHLDEHGFEAIKEMAVQKQDKQSRRWALEVMLDRGFGRPTEVLDVSNRDGNELSLDEIEQELSELAGGEPGKVTPPSQPSAGTA